MVLDRSIFAVCSYGSGRQVMARESLDALLATAVFGQKLTLLFCGEGVWQLVAAQGDYSGSDKALIHSLDALPLYDVHDIFVDAASLRERGLDEAQLLPIAQAIEPETARDLFDNCQHIMSF